MRLRLPVRAARRLLPGAQRRVLRLRPAGPDHRLRPRLARAHRPRRREGHRPPGARGARPRVRRAATTTSAPCSSGACAQLDKPVTVQRRGRSAREGHGRPLPGLRRRRRAAARPHPVEVDLFRHFDDRPPPQPSRPADRPRAASRPPRWSIATKPTKLGPRPQGRRRARLPGQADAAAADRSRRVAATARSTSCASASTRSASPSRRSSARAPTRSPSACRACKNAERAAQQVGTTAQLYFYDWEPNVLGANCKADDDAARRRGPAPDHRALPARSSSASKLDIAADEADGQDVRQAARYYALRQGLQAARSTTGSPPDSAKEALWRTSTPAQQGHSAEVRRACRPACVVARATEKPSADVARRRTPACVLARRPGAERHRHQEPRAELRPAAPATQPIVTFDFTEQGPQGLPERSRARSPSAGRQRSRRPRTPRDLVAALRDRARQRARLARRTIDYRENPDGIDGPTGAQISGGFTIQSAQDLAKILKIGALPIKLELISHSQVSATLGKQALHQGLIAGLAAS